MTKDTKFLLILALVLMLVMQFITCNLVTEDRAETMIMARRIEMIEYMQGQVYNRMMGYTVPADTTQKEE